MRQRLGWIRTVTAAAIASWLPAAPVYGANAADCVRILAIGGERLENTNDPCTKPTKKHEDRGRRAWQERVQRDRQLKQDAKDRHQSDRQAEKARLEAAKAKDLERIRAKEKQRDAKKQAFEFFRQENEARKEAEHLRKKQLEADRRAELARIRDQARRDQAAAAAQKAKSCRGLGLPANCTEPNPGKGTK